MGLPLPWGAASSAAPRWAPACAPRRRFWNPQPPRAARPWRQPPGRSAGPNTEPVAGSCRPERRRVPGQGSALTVRSSTRCSKKSSSAFSTQLRAPVPSWQPGRHGGVCARTSCPLPKAKERFSPHPKTQGRLSQVHTQCERGRHSQPGCPQSGATIPSPLLPPGLVLGLTAPYPTAQPRAGPLTATARSQTSCSSSTANPTPETAAPTEQRAPALTPTADKGKGEPGRCRLGTQCRCRGWRRHQSTHHPFTSPSSTYSPPEHTLA